MNELQLPEPEEIPQDAVISSFEGLIAELKSDGAPYKAYGVRYPALELPWRTSRKVLCGIQAVEYTTVATHEEHGLISMFNFMVGFFAMFEIGQVQVFECRFATRTWNIGGQDIDEDRAVLLQQLRSLYEVRLCKWLMEPTNFLSE